MKKQLFVSSLFLLINIQFSFSTNYYVKSNATGDNNGTSWDNAFTDLQSALSVSTYNDSIFVAAGTYKPGTTVSDRPWYQITCPITSAGPWQRSGGGWAVSGPAGARRTSFG